MAVSHSQPWTLPETQSEPLLSPWPVGTGVLRSTGSTLSCRSIMLGAGSNLPAVPDSTRQAHQTASAQAARDRSTSAAPHLTATMDSCTHGMLPVSLPESRVSMDRLTLSTRYMPKDSPSDGLGHRHEWEGVVVWLKSATSTAASNVAAVCPSAHGEWNCATSGYTLSGTRPLIEYKSTWPVNHQMGLTTAVGGSQPLIAWESLPTAARNALETTDFVAATVPFKDSTFTNNLAAATF